MAKAKAAKAKGLSTAEKGAMKEMLAERAGKGEGEAAVLAAIAKMPPSDRAMAERFHAIVKANAPSLTPKTWYGFPAYASKEGVVCFFKAASKFKERYATLGFNTPAKLDEGAMWVTSFALLSIGDAAEKRIAALLKKAVG
ncbi:MAG: hypothetical protein QOE90_375 [Thermoplasmata archaeon]|jgi:uncharacterized protein YdhG (YjbR/CyaY superfamily)|nr:hypothetical protein [Thermoplasmata archaeon]